MLKVYALLMNRWMMECQALAYSDCYEVAEEEYHKYTSRMERLYLRLEREYGFSKEKFYSLQDQAVTF